MGKITDSLVNFSGGELSPKVDARVDQPKYRQGLRQCQNMMPYKTGGMTRRIGTQHMGTGKYTTLNGGICCNILQRFQFSPTTSFILEFGHRYVRFYSNGQQVLVDTTQIALWVANTFYHVGDYAKDPANNLVYYCIQDVISAVQPHSAPIKWVQQTILEQPTPYCAVYWPATGSYTPPTWATGVQYFSGDFVNTTTFIYRCVTTNIAGATFAADLALGYWELAPIPSGGLVPQAPLTPFETDIYFITPCEINDVVYLAHDQYPPYSLTRFTDTSWKSVQVPFLTPALLDQNATDTVLTPSALRGTITLTASAPAWISANYYQIGNSVQVTGQIYICTQANVSGLTFAADQLLGYWSATSIFNVQHIGSTWQLAALRDSAYIEYDGVAATGFSAGTSSTIQCLGSWEVHTYGVWDADIAIQRSLDGGITWNTVRKVTGRSDRNVDITGIAAVVAVYRIVVSNTHAIINAGATNPRVVFECVNAFLYGLVQITAWTSVNQVTGTVITQLSDTNALAPQWVSGQAYTAGTAVSYNFVGYTAINNITSTTPPSQDTTNWAYTAPGGTEFWSEAAWSNYRGFPRAVTSFQQRLIYGGSGFESQRIWGTVTNDIENFALGDQTLATDSFAFDLNAPGRGPISWLIAQTDLFVGFSGAEWVVNSGANTTSTSGTATITPSSVNAVEHSTWGSSIRVRPFIAGDAVMYTQRQGTSLRQMTFSIYTNKYMSQDLTSLSDHLFSSGIAQMGYQNRWRKQSVIWAVMKQGTLCGMTYEIDQEVFGWHRHTTGYGQVDPTGAVIVNDNGFESVAVIEGQSLNDDEVWVVANRMIGGVQTRFIERINPANWEETFVGSPLPPSANPFFAYYVDCGISGFIGSGNGFVFGIRWLVGRYVVGLVDGIAFGPTLVDASGTVTLPSTVNQSTSAYVVVGLPISYAGQPMRIDADPRAGNTQGLNKTISDIYVRVYNSMGGSVSNGTSNYSPWISGTAYLAGNFVISPANQKAYYCTVSVTGATDPSADASHWSVTTLPSYQKPVPLDYVPNGTPGSLPVFVASPKDLRITPMQNPTIGKDPVFVVSGNDALPITVLALILHYDLTGVA